MNQHPSWKRVQRDGINDGPDPFLNYPNLPFNLRDVLVGTCQVKLRRSIHRRHPNFKRSKFPVSLYEDNLKTPLKVITAHAFQCVKNGESFPIAQVRNQQKAYDQTVGDEEWYLVAKKYVNRQGNILVQLPNLLRDLNDILSNYWGGRPNRLPL